MAPRFSNAVATPSPLFDTSWQCGGAWQGIINIPVVGLKVGVPLIVKGSSALPFDSPLQVGAGITMVVASGAALVSAPSSGIIVGSIAASITWGNTTIATLTQGTYTGPNINVSATVFTPVAAQGTLTLQITAWAALFGSKGS